MGTPRRWASSLVIAAIAVIAPAAGRAQICAGLPSLRERPVVLGGSYSVSKSGWSVGGDATLGRAAFVNLAAGHVVYRKVDFGAVIQDAHSTALHLGGGWALEGRPDAGAGRAPTLGVCPAAYVEYETGPDRGGPVPLDSDGLTWGGGLSVGAAVRLGATTRAIPFAGLAFVHTSSTMHGVPFPGTDTKASDSGGLLDVGVGIAFGALSVVPEVAVPLGIEGAETTFGVGVSVSLGRGRSAGSARR